MKQVLPMLRRPVSPSCGPYWTTTPLSGDRSVAVVVLAVLEPELTVLRRRRGGSDSSATWWAASELTSAADGGGGEWLVR